MTAHSDHDYEYGDDFVAGLEWVWGEGFLSPGGPEEVCAIVEGLDLSGKRLMDIGCGLGGADVVLAGTLKAGHVVGIDIEEPLVRRARQIVSESGLEKAIEIRLVEPGPLPFDAGSFDIVFSKDSIIHIPDKPKFYIDVLRVLRPGGVFVGSDWLTGRSDGGRSEAMQKWINIAGLTFDLENLKSSKLALEAAGFEHVTMTDRHEWFRGQMKSEVDAVSGENYARLVAQLGEEAAAQRRGSTVTRQQVVEQGELRPTHFRAFKSAG
jgi:phosphoethanolamine N-methyltransferase